jgi:negative regulator of sigma E activity
MNVITDEDLSAFVDNELPAEQAQDIRRALVGNSDLQKRLENLAMTGSVLSSAYNSINESPIPSSVLELLEANSPESSAEDPAVIPFKRTRQISRSQSALTGTTAIAASVALIVGLGFGSFLPNQRQSADNNREYEVAGRIDPSNPFHQVLESTPSAGLYAIDGDENIVASPILTFQTAEGVYCREYRITFSDRTQHGVACREENLWNVVLAATDIYIEASDSEYLTASDQFGSLIGSHIDQMIATEPFSREQENRAIAGKWKGDQ